VAYLRWYCAPLDTDVSVVDIGPGPRPDLVSARPHALAQRLFLKQEDGILNALRAYDERNLMISGGDGA
jgi:hypothetical protein